MILKERNLIEGCERSHRIGGKAKGQGQKAQSQEDPIGFMAKFTCHHAMETA